MSQQVTFYRKNFIDLSRNDVSITITDSTASDNGQAYVNFMRNRNNRSFWLTTGSNDAANTQIDIAFGDTQPISDFIIVEHNLSDFTIQYFDGSSFVDFSTAINESGNTETTNYFSFNEVETDQIRITITGTQVPDADKRIAQLYACQRIATGQLEGFPTFSPTHNTNKKINRLLSGKVNVIESVGALKLSMRVQNWNISNDITIVENLYFNRQGFHVSISSGDDQQFSIPTVGYRKKDIYFMRMTNDYEPVLFANYRTGYQISMELEEAIS